MVSGSERTIQRKRDGKKKGFVFLLRMYINGELKGNCKTGEWKEKEEPLSENETERKGWVNFLFLRTYKTGQVQGQRRGKKIE